MSKGLEGLNEGYYVGVWRDHAKDLAAMVFEPHSTVPAETVADLNLDNAFLLSEVIFWKDGRYQFAEFNEDQLALIRSRAAKLS